MKLNQLRKNHALEWLLLDLLMLVLVALNLGLILFDWFFEYENVQALFLQYLPTFYNFYEPVIHQNFIWIDLCFVGVFLTELGFRWALAIYRKEYESWFLFPFAHWYDVLGCIPIGSFRFLRILRIFSIFYRLERLEILHLRNTSLARLIGKYYGILVEEVSDRVVINILDGVKKEVNTGTPMVEKVVQNIILPHKEALLLWLNARIGEATALTYERHREQIKIYLGELIARGVEKNKEMQRMGMVPVVGGLVTSTIEKAVTDIVFNIVNEAMLDIAANKNQLVDDMADLVFETLIGSTRDPEIGRIASQVFTDSLDVIKDKVAEKQWKLVNLPAPKDDKQ
jgi:hypothetical protein